MNLPRSQVTDAVLMIRPAAFRSNPQTAASNAFQDTGALPAAAAHEQAEQEFDAAVDALVAAGVTVHVFDDTPEPRRPDAIFPNNWISTHADGTVVVYPMQAPNRRAEVRRDIVAALAADLGYRVDRVLDLTPWADRERFLEGTGSMVLDRVNRVAFAANSLRTDREVLDAFATELDYRPVLFDARDRDGVPIYHTNVMMWIGTTFAAVCLDAVSDGTERQLLRDLAGTGRELIELDFAQVSAFAGNALELRAADGVPVLALSRSAHDSLTPGQREALFGRMRAAVADISAIEACSGGSFRCMIAEIFLPRSAPTE